MSKIVSPQYFMKNVWNSDEEVSEIREFAETQRSQALEMLMYQNLTVKDRKKIQNNLTFYTRALNELDGKFKKERAKK